MGLAELKLSNGEAAMLESVAHFIRFMKAENAPIPETRKEFNALLTRYVKQVRREQMQYVSALRVSRGEAPLPKRLLL